MDAGRSATGGPDAAPLATRTATRTAARSADARGLVAGAIALVVGAVFGAILSSPAPLWGAGSVGAVAAIFAGLAGGASFAVGYVLASRGGARWRARRLWRHVLDTVGLAFTAAGVAVLLTSSLFAVLALAFRDLEVDRLAASAVVAATTGASALIMSAIASDMTTRRLSVLLGLFLLAGCFASMLTTEQPDWWRANFSTLGAGTAVSAATFNLTIIVAGTAILTLADFVTFDLHARSRRAERVHGPTVVRGLLFVVGVALIGVGWVPVSENEPLHKVFAYGLLAGFAALILVVPLAIAGLTRAFTSTTTVFLAVLLGMVLLYWPVGYFNTTALELLSVIVIFGWLMLFARTIGDPAESPRLLETADARSVGASARGLGAVAATPSAGFTGSTRSQGCTRPGSLGSARALGPLTVDAVLGISAGLAAGLLLGRRSSR
ncbi:hypothetical protein GCM10027515_00600 [Schumannella luteola]|uniref:Putative membrane protein n=1 Tax=Schumannella luteola TaxID=472059 RepID=A0A852YM30_9MICO|nr:DUF998 domain-containing protein [Schumannella luteola]NYG98799.1 putative membrane protein [Schumannella luteola]TPX01937.1 DUF998 domain-containing protein [Schumannella luteola]